jgi:predicted ArsR family transcriptional regulator
VDLSRAVIAKALSSEASWKILELLVTRELEASEISKSLGIKYATVKRYLRKLIDSKAVNVREATSSSGRVRSVYRLAGTGVSIGFPPRNYMYLSEAMINGLRSSLGEDGARTLLYDIGLRIGEDLAHALNSRTKLTSWGPKAYVDYFVKGILQEMGTYPKVIRVGRRQAIYEQLNCPFQDLASKYPGFVCDILDEAVRKGMDRKLGGMETKVLKCKGHGDPACRFAVVWHPRKSVAANSEAV